MEFLSQESSSSFQLINDFHHVNEFLQAVGMRCFSEEEKSSWNMYSKSSKSVYCNRLLEIMKKIITTVFPQDIEDVLHSVTNLLSSNDQEQKPPVIPTGSFGPLVDSFKKAESWRHKRQILSFLTQTMSYNQVFEMLPDVSENKYYAAKSHATIVGPGLPLTTSSTRQRMDPVKLDNFLDFITSSHVVRDLPYGERKIKMSDGSVHEMPNVVRCMGSSDVIQQYKVYCSENNLCPSGKKFRKTLLYHQQ
ncbi:uncharacterized protein LOC143052084 [Mytilus galloprovincialis]|uniref:uncharacterized protein LOC143052084 n=1 Tax=Mytilus galloprovincialis TaxID=29158 RepID=UPI003F7B36A4